MGVPLHLTRSFVAQRLDMSGQSLKTCSQVVLDNGKGDAHIAIAARSESDPRHDRGVATRQKIAREIEGAAPGRTDIDERVEGSFRNDRQQLRVSEYIDDNVATAPITVAKGLDDRLIAVEGGFCRLLRNGGSAGGDGLLQARCHKRQLA